MTHAATASAAIAAASMRAERHIVRALRDAGATSASAAIVLRPDRLIRRGALRRLVRRGAVRPAGDLYWLDEAGFTAMGERRKGAARLILVWTVGVALVLVALALWTRLG